MKSHLSKKNEEVSQSMQTPEEKTDGCCLRSDDDEIYLPKCGCGYIKSNMSTAAIGPAQAGKKDVINPENGKKGEGNGG